MLISQTTEWIIFGAIVVFLLYLDLRVGHRKAHQISLKEALLWSLLWIICGLTFGVGVYYINGPTKGWEFITGFLLEKSLSVDNLFVFLLIFRYFHIPRQYEYHALFWGIIGAIIIRAVFIFAGVALVEQFNWIIYLFGAFLIYTAVKMAMAKDKEIHPEQNPLIKFLRRFIPITHEYHSTKLFIKRNKRYVATPLFVIICMLMTMDVMFAIDSIPAIIAITRDPFIIYTSNVFALMGLRSLFFALAGLLRAFHYLHYGLSVLLFYIGVKMLISWFFHIPTLLSLGVIIFILSVAVLASLWHNKKLSLVTPQQNPTNTNNPADKNGQE
ncbi:MAG: TerC family protein [Deltaproteobacteria bacterium]|nr:TerC family protein [Deltaproteobacteria bacterium]